MEPEQSRIVRRISDDLYEATFFFEGWRLTNIDIEIKDPSAVPPADLGNIAALGQWVYAVWGGIAQAMTRVPPKTLPIPATRDGRPHCPTCGVVLDMQPKTCQSGEQTYRCGKCGMQYRHERGAKG